MAANEDTFNEFWNQSTYKDENQGAADAGATGGSNSASSSGSGGSSSSGSGSSGGSGSSSSSNNENGSGSSSGSSSSSSRNSGSSSSSGNSGSSLDSATKYSISSNKASKAAAKAASENSVNSVNSAIQTSIASKLTGTLFKGSNFVFPAEMLNNIRLNAVNDGIMNSLGKGLGVSSVFENGINGYLQNQFSTLGANAGDTWSFLQKVGGKFAQNILNAIDGLEINKTYIPEVVYLAGLMKFKPIKSNIDYKNKYIRKLCLVHDFPLVLKFVDDESGVRYSVSKSSGMSEAIKAAKYGSWHVARYIMRELKKEIGELEALYPTPEKYNREADQQSMDRYNNTIKESENQLENTPPENIALRKALQESIDEQKRKRDALFINTENEYKKDPNYAKTKTLIKKGKMQLHKITKEIIVNAYSDLTIWELKNIVSEFDIHPSAFGTKDKEFGKSCAITPSDLNIIAPIFKPKPDNSISGELNNLPKTRLTKSVTDKEINIKYIKPRNQFCKKIYVYLQSTGIHSKKAMYNKPYKERMELPVYSTVVGALDQAMSGFFKTGLGKQFVDTLNSVESAYYDYTISIEKELWMPTRTTFFNFNDFTKIPSLDPEDYEEETASTSTGTKNGTTNGKSGTSSTGKKINAASGDNAKTKENPSNLPPENKKKRRTGFDENGDPIETDEEIFYPSNFDPENNENGCDANGNPIVGYPSDADVAEAITAGKIGPGCPVSSNGAINPIIGYNSEGEAIYGSAIFYPTTKPIDVDEENNPIFGYELETKEITSSNVDSLSDDEVEYYLRKEYKYEEYQLNPLSAEEKRNLLKTNVEKEPFYIAIGNKPILGYNEDGDPVYGRVKRFSVTDKGFGYDIKGRKILSYTENGKPIIGIDKYGYPVIGSSKLEENGTTSDGKTVYGYVKNSNGDMIPVYGFSPECKPLIMGYGGVLETTDAPFRLPIGRTGSGYTIYAYDNLARPIIGYDINCNPILGYAKVNDEIKCIIGYETNGTPIYSIPIVSEPYILKEISVKIRTSSKDASDFGYVSTKKSDWDLKTELGELEAEVMHEVFTDYQPRILKLVVM